LPVIYTSSEAKMNGITDQKRYDVCVIGGGFMGAAVALGLVREGATVLMVDRVSKIHKASRGNFGLVWSQSKGSGNRPYARLSEKAVRAFDGFAREIEAESGIDVELRLGAGLVLSIGEQELAARTAVIEKMHAEAAACGETHPSQMLDRNEVQELVGKAALGEAVSGGSFSHIDGDVNPLLLLKAMRKVFIKKGGNFVQGCKVDGISRQADHYHLATPLGNIEAQKLVMAAGLGNILLFSKLGKTIPLVPQKGQLLVTERIKPFLSFPFSGIRQTGCGSVMIGYTNENTGFDTETTVPAAMQLAKRAVTIFPALRHARVVRSWASLRILTGDGLPIYDHVEGYPGCYILAAHSCITLAPLHASLLAQWILGAGRPAEIEGFNLERFNGTAKTTSSKNG
jgi:glycine/D-amino acid oxidase-like deaminating enzyme